MCQMAPSALGRIGLFYSSLLPAVVLTELTRRQNCPKCQKSIHQLQPETEAGHKLPSSVRAFSDQAFPSESFQMIHYHLPPFLFLSPATTITCTLKQSKQLSFDVTSKGPLSLSSVFCPSPIFLHQQPVQLPWSTGGGNPRSGRQVFGWPMKYEKI